MDAVRDVAAEVSTVPELGAELSRRVGALVPHDGYILVGLDPVTGAGCLVDRQHCYSGALRHRLELEVFHRRRPHLFTELFAGTRTVQVIGSGFVDERRDPYLHDDLRWEGFGAELRLALRHRGVALGWMVLLREIGRRPFSAREAQVAEDLTGHLAVALRAFVAAKPLRPTRPGLPTGVVVVDGRGSIASATAAGRSWLRTLTEDFRITDDELPVTLLNIALIARTPGGLAVSRVPTPRGWLAISAETLDGTHDGDVAITLRPAPGEVLLPAVCGWYGITAGERAVVEHVLRGLPTKTVARRLALSPHTVHDHLKSAYRKTGVAGREELLACLG
ncbi:MAG: helix-turn-helix transcriptional regulator [Saccharothrix sp.]|nr:helix-turn-helix transcriptional regulator [Saccharothrix sp.]